MKKEINIFGNSSSETSAKIILLPIPYDFTTTDKNKSSSQTANQILDSSFQIDNFSIDFPPINEKDIWMKKIDRIDIDLNDSYKEQFNLYYQSINYLSFSFVSNYWKRYLNHANSNHTQILSDFQVKIEKYLNKNKIIGVIGGDHSNALPNIKAYTKKNKFSILQIDAHADLRTKYFGVESSHASLMYNIIKDKKTWSNISTLIQLGLRDICQEEYQIIKNNKKIKPYFSSDISKRMFEGENWKEIVDDIIENLDEKIYISFDIDGLTPEHCLNSGFPVPGGINYEQIYYLFKKILNY